MQYRNFSLGWKFILEKDCDCFPSFGFRKCGGATGPAGLRYHEGLMREVSLPHDWGMELDPSPLTNTEKGGRPISPYMSVTTSPDGRHKLETYPVGWYRKHFKLDGELSGKRIFLEFEGVFRDYSLFINGIYMARHESGYTPAVFDITDQVRFGEDNVIALRVDASQPEGWWYEGAGIYRPVHLHVKDQIYIPHHTTFVQSKPSGEVKISTALCSALEEAEQTVTLECRIKDGNGKVVAKEQATVSIPALGKADCGFALQISSPRLWDVENPYLYVAELEILEGGFEEKEEICFGIREFHFDADKGFFLNGKHLKLRGACMHQDFGGFGVAVPKDIAVYKIKLLKEMGMNAYRASHHPASEDILDACDRLGVLVIDEVRLFGSSPEALEQMQAMVLAHRNHPSVFMWSLGNEEFVNYIQSSDAGEKMARTAYCHLKKLDSTRPVTYGANNGAVDTGISAAMDVHGFNYIRNLERLTHDKSFRHLPGYNADRYHREHPDTPMLGTEEGSHFFSRDTGYDQYEKGLLSSVGDNTAMGGSTAEGWVKFYEERDFLAGGFLWTGIDYYGEPAPFTDRNLSSSFGALDLVGIPKNTYHYYRSCWLEQPILEILPHWDFEAGQTVKIGVYSNCEEITLYLNGEVIGQKTLEKLDSALFRVAFTPGRLEAVGIRQGIEYRTHIDTPSKPSALSLSMRQEGEIGIFDVAIVDGQGNICRRADRPISFDISGEGQILGVGNGDPASTEKDQYLGKTVLYPLTDLTVTEEGMTTPFTPPALDDTSRVFVGTGADSVFKSSVFEDTLPPYRDRYRLKWQFSTEGEKTLYATYEAEIENAAEWEFVEFTRLFGSFEISLNGEIIGESFPEGFYFQTTMQQNTPYRFPCCFKEGKNRLTVRMNGKNTQQFGIFGGVYVGKTLPAEWKRSTFFGRARLFAKLPSNGSFTLSAKAEGLTEATLTVARNDSMQTAN